MDCLPLHCTRPRSLVDCLPLHYLSLDLVVSCYSIFTILFLCSVLWTIFSLFCHFSSRHCIVCSSIRDFWLPLCIFIFFLAKAINIKALHNTDITDVTDVDSFLIVLTLYHLYKLLNLCSFPLTVTSRNPRFPVVK